MMPPKVPAQPATLTNVQGLAFIGRYEDRSRDHGSDIEICFSGNIALTPVRLW
ncbi:MAG: hypothetical protein F6K09_31985 [Merismopedia sp. SIO2A8]|nr:hypothetical protein [Merismopedia sp. SIO2A8]